MIQRTIDRIYPYRLTVLLLIHITLVVAANQAAFWLRFDGPVPVSQQPFNTTLLPLLICLRIAVFFPLGLHRGLWRYASIWDLRNIVDGVILSSLLFWGVTHGLLGLTQYPRSVFIIDAILLVCLMGGVRLGRRFHAASRRSEGGRRVLIYGAGDAGEMIVRDMNSAGDYDPIGFIDDDPRKADVRIHGVPVLGNRGTLAKVVEEHRPHEVLVAMPSATASMVKDVVRALEHYKIPIKTLPKLRDIVDERLLVSHIRNLKIEDLLARPPIGLETASLERLVKGKRVLVTGAGGSIGSELCKQIAQLQPDSMALFDRYENGLFAAANSLARIDGDCFVETLVGDITDSHRLESVMSAFRPCIVFHAAAHKHVPLMEGNPCEAVKNNVFGTRMVMEAASRHCVERFVLISTDKAVNPTSVMGATKRIAELLVQAMNHRGKTAYVAVRFGNVLASNGSVVPTFLDQIKAGGPVTVTHPDMRRYFMLIPEAVQLVLHAAALAEAGALYVLDMGEQVKLVDMARNLIRLSGSVPDDEIAIVFTGCRPGEKLFEELVGDDERSEPSGVDKILRVRSEAPIRLDWLRFQINELERLAAAGDVGGTLFQLGCILPTFELRSSLVEHLTA